MGNLSSVTPTWIIPKNTDEYFIDVTEAEDMNKQYFLLSNTPARQFELTFTGLSNEQYINLLAQYRDVSGEYAVFYWKSISPQFYSLLGTDLSLKIAEDIVGSIDLDVTGAISCKGRRGEGWGMEFDGKDDCLVSKASGATTVINFDYWQNFSIAFWAKIPETQLDVTNSYNFILSKQNSSASYPFSFKLYNSGTSEGKILFDRKSGDSNPVCYSTSLLNNDQWQHVVGVRGTASGTSKNFLYVNATVESNVADTCVSETSNAANFAAGHYQFDGTYDFKGSIDELRIYNIELTAASIALLYAGTSTLTNCVAAWDFEDVSMYGRWVGMPEFRPFARSWDAKMIFERA